VDDEVRGALAVVVGGNQGIGAAIAEGLAAAGCALVLGARDEQRLAATRERIGGEVDVATLDLRSVASIRAFADGVLATHGTPRILVNSAGGALHKPVLDVTEADWDALHETHLKGAFFLSQAFGGAMVAAGYGKIIHLSSTWASVYTPGRSVYAAAKAGLGHLTTALAIEWAPAGVCVNAIAPTSTLTPRVVERLRSEGKRPDEPVPGIPMGRRATPEDIVGTALFLASPASDFITGQTIVVDGGFQHAK
jgi:NAD(P)-dependent dehydrogenase (short-subunit alcohol dehydrogenase family)